MEDHTPENPYAPPTDEVEPALREAAGRKLGRAATWCFVAALLLVLSTIGLTSAASSALVAFVGFVTAGLVGLAGVVCGFVSLVRVTRATGQVATGFTIGVFFAVIANGVFAFLGALAAFFATSGFSRGRQLRRFGRVLLPPVRPGAAWADAGADELGERAGLDGLHGPPLAASVEAPARAGLAAQWRENGRTEHASVAAFARLALDLVALGAPPALVAAAHRDALDEIRHAELCFSLARALDGASESPGAFPAAARARALPSSRPLALAMLAVDSLVDGALHEGASARVIAKLAKRCEVPQIRAVLREIAADEGRHAAHGWDVVEWCLAEGGAVVADALRGAVRVIPHRMHSILPAPAEDGGWERYGIHGRALEAARYAETRADLVRRVERLLAALQPLAA